MNQGELFDPGPRREPPRRPSKAKVKRPKPRRKQSRRITLEWARAHILTRRINPYGFVPDEEQAAEAIGEFESWLRVERIDRSYQPVYRSQKYACSEERLMEFLAGRGWGWRTADHKPVRLRDGRAGDDDRPPVPGQPGYAAWVSAEVKRLYANMRAAGIVPMDDNT